MAKVEQKVGLDASDYIKSQSKMAKETQNQMKRVNSEFSQTGDKIEDFTDGAKKNVTTLNSAFGELFKDLAGKLKGLPIAKFAAIGTALAGAAKGQAALDRQSTTSNQLGFQQGLDNLQTSGLKNRLFDVSSAANIDFDEVAEAAKEGIGRGATTEGAVDMAEIASILSRLSDDLDPRAAAEFIGRTLQASGQEINEKNSRQIADAVAVSTRNGFRDAAESISVLSEFDPKALSDANISTRELVNMLGGLRTGVGVGRDESTTLLKELIGIQRGDIGQAEAFAGITGVQLRKGEQFQLKEGDLKSLQSRLEQLGETRVRRQLVKDTGLSEGAADALLTLAKNPDKFLEAQKATAGDVSNVQQAFDAATNTVTETISGWFRTAANEALFKDLFVVGGDAGTVALPQEDLGTGEDVNKIFEQAAKAPPKDFTSPQGAPQTATDPSAEKRIKVDIEVDTKDPGFLAKPKATDNFRTPGGF